MTRLVLAALAYVVPTFALGLVWHLVLFKSYYDALAIYRSDIIIPFGLLSMLIQAGIFAWIYEKAFAERRSPFARRRLPMASWARRSRGASPRSPSPPRM
jgi:ABC-type sugar transport system permease subunit